MTGIGRARGWLGSPGAPRSALLRAVPAALVVALAVLFPVWEGGQAATIGLASEVLVYGLATFTLNLLVGYGGQVSIGHAGLLAVGAYTAGYIAEHGNYPVVLPILAAGVVTGLVGVLLGLPAGRLRGHYLAVATLGFGVAVSQIALNLGSITGGFEGMVVPPPQLGPLQFATPVAVYYLCLVVVVLCTLLLASLLASRTGRSFQAVRDREEAAAAMGIPVGRTKVVLFTTSSFFCGIAGALFAYNNGYVHPSSFNFALSLFFLAAVVVGGLGSIWGSFLGAALLVIVQNAASSSGGFSEVVIGAAVTAVLLFLPGGLVAIPRLGDRWRSRSREMAPVRQEDADAAA